MNIAGVFFLSVACFLAAGGEKEFDSRQWMTNYYRAPRPESFVVAVRTMAKEGTFKRQSALPPLQIFLSQVMAKNPGKISGWVEELQDEIKKYPEFWKGVLWHSQTEEGKRILLETSKKGGEEYEDKIARGPQPVHEMTPDSPAVLDMNWGNFLATGDIRPVRNIIRALQYAEHADAPKKYKDSQKTDDDKAKAQMGVTFLAARWSIDSNCSQHPLVLKYCKELLVSGDLSKNETIWLAVILSRRSPKDVQIQLQKKVKTKPAHSEEEEK